MKQILFQILVFFVTGSLHSILAVAQQTEILSPDAFIQQVRQFHPVAKQADIITAKAKADLLTARGNFDPVFEMNTANKTLDGTRYFRYNNPELKIPALPGIDIKTGIENSNGQFTNPELTNGVASYIGIEVPLLKGLLMDKRRAVLQQARIYQKQSRQEQLTVLNDLLFDAYTAYWQWAGAFKMYRIYTNFTDVAGKRLQLVTLTYRNGDRAMADTVEAYTQLQSYRIMQNDALIALNKSVFDLSQYLWTSTGNPYILPEKYVPDTLAFEMKMPLPNLDEQLNLVTASHPLIKTYQFKLQDLEVERKLKLQGLLPVVNVQANILSKEYYNYKTLDAAYFENNYKFGVHVKVPLLLRQARGEYKNTRLKINDVNLALNDKNWQLQLKVRQYYNEAELLNQQLATAKSMSGNYNFLLKNEELKFSQGESSLFLVNSRENKVLEIQQKLIDLNVKYLKSVYAMQWSAGALK